MGEKDTRAVKKENLLIKLKDQRVILLFLIILISIIVWAINPRFLGIKNILNIIQQISVTGILTMAMAILMLSGGVDLSIGNIMALSGCTISVLITAGSAGVYQSVAGENMAQPGLTSVPVAILIGLLVAIAAGFLNGLIIAKSRCMPLIISLSMSGLYFGIALLITGGDYMSFKEVFDSIRLTYVSGIPLVMLIFLFVVIVAFIVVKWTKYGRRIVAIGGNEENARLSGINVDMYKILTYTISGLLCGIAAIVYATRLDSITAGSGAGYEISALTGAIIGGITFEGGKGSILGAFLGVFFIGLISNAMNVLNIQSAIQTIVTAIIVVIAVVTSNIKNIRKN